MTPSSPIPALAPPGAAARARRVLLSGAILSALTTAATGGASAQYRFGVSFGGASTVALLVEYRWAHQGLEVQAGTWQFRDLSLSVNARQYVGSYRVEPFVGFGLWGIVARAEEGTGYGLIARFPTGLNWDVGSRHAVSMNIYLNRALALKRPDREDRRPPRTRIIPLPELSYRFGSGG